MVQEIKKEIEIWANKKIVYEKESRFLEIKNMIAKILNTTVREKIRQSWRKIWNWKTDLKIACFVTEIDNIKDILINISQES